MSWSILFLSTTDWDAPQFGSRQQIARELSRRGHSVLYVDVPRALHSLVSDPVGTRRAVPRMGRVRRVAEGLVAYTPPPILPVYYHPLVNPINQRLLHAYLRRATRHLDWRPDVLWTYWPHTAYLVGRLGARAAVYHCIDDFSAVSYPLTPRGAIGRMEAEQCRRVDLVFARTRKLADAKRRHNVATYLLPGGIDVVHFDPARAGDPRPDVRALPAPRVGMVGTFDDRVDVGLVARCAEEIGEASFVFVGPIKHHRVGVRRLNALDNVSLLPACNHLEVPGIVAALDVCLIPYRVNAYTEGLSPIKLYECLAMGKPVVATDLPYVRREAANVRLASSADEFISAIREALAHPASAEERRRWRAAAGEHSWVRQVDEIERYLTPALEARS